jgi:glucose/mannose transport system permease protein
MRAETRNLRILVIITLAVLTFAYILPMYVVVITSLKTPADIVERQYLLPSADLHFSNYAESFRLILPALKNSGIVSVVVTALSLLFGGLGGYFLSRTRTAFAKVLFILVGIAIYLPYQVILIPLVQFVAWLGKVTGTNLALSLWGLILSYLILNVPLAAVLLGTFFTSIPRELEEAAEVDGANRIQIFFKVVTPVALPAYASTAILIFTQVWNEFLLALTLATPATQTIQMKLEEIQGSFVARYELQMAAALITLVIPLIFFLALGQYFIRGILAGALKG